MLSGLLKRKKQAPESMPKNVPQHVAIIMDGNGRWARARGLPRTAGHKKGADALRTILNTCRDTGVHYLTIYAFSAENWRRPADEISDLMQLLRHYLEKELPTLHENGIRLRFIGDTSQLQPDIKKQMEKALILTAGNTRFNFTIALSYGSRQEIMRAMRKLAIEVQENRLTPDAISEERISLALDTVGLPEPDLLIRTGGEQRLSNFLLWQAAYTEFYFTPVLWPDFGTEEFLRALHEYAGRNRRFGTTGEA